jgi:hypothetical protein
MANAESIETLKAEILTLLPLDASTRAVFDLGPHGEEWVARVRLISDHPRFEISAAHWNELGAMQKLLSALHALQGHFTGEPI